MLRETQAANAYRPRELHDLKYSNLLTASSWSSCTAACRREEMLLLKDFGKPNRKYICSHPAGSYRSSLAEGNDDPKPIDIVGDREPTLELLR